MASRAWSEAEMELIGRHAADNNWRAVVDRVPDRTETAVKVRMTKLRRELGFEDGRFTACDQQERFNENAIVGSQRLAEATLRVGRWS